MAHAFFPVQAAGTWRQTSMDGEFVDGLFQRDFCYRLNAFPAGAGIERTCRCRQLGETPNPVDNLRRRVSGLDRDSDHASAARLDDVAPDDGVLGPVGAF